VTAEFVRETELTRQALGMPDLEAAVIDHPVSSITQEEVDVRVRQIKEKAQRIWTADAENVGGSQVMTLMPATDEVN
jgi:hypothetical protein